MKNQNEETLDDIEAEIRARAKAWPEPSLAKYDEQLADRIHAAREREVVVSKNATTTYGNNAAMRDALIRARDMLFAWRRDVPFRAWNEIGETIDKCNAALEKPSRNCDLFCGDYKMLHTAWFDWTGSPSGQNPDGTAKMGFGEWLLALAGKRGAV